MRSAFSTATAAAKVPDGRVSNSIASREAACNCFIGDVTQDRVVFVLQPSIAVGSLRYDIVQGATNLDPTVPVRANDQTTTALFDANNFVSNAANANAPDKYRIVSAAMRLSCVNASEYNNGWFEAIRVPTEYSTNEYSMMSGQEIGQVGIANIGRVPNPTWEDNIMVSSKWCNHPSYVTGKLSNLYKHQFYLQPIADREFVRNSPIGDVNASDGLDRNFDTVLIRISATTNALIPLGIHWHTCFHIETQHDAGSASARYHSQCFSAPNLVAKVDAQIKKDPKASIIRSPNSFAYNP